MGAVLFYIYIYMYTHTCACVCDIFITFCTNISSIQYTFTFCKKYKKCLYKSRINYPTRHPHGRKVESACEHSTMLVLRSI